jgi:ribosomal protein S26
VALNSLNCSVPVRAEGFTPRDADSKRWGILVTVDESQVSNFDQSSIINNWRKIATSEYLCKITTNLISWFLVKK